MSLEENMAQARRLILAATTGRSLEKLIAQAMADAFNEGYAEGGNTLEADAWAVIVALRAWQAQMREEGKNAHDNCYVELCAWVSTVENLLSNHEPFMNRPLGA